MKHLLLLILTLLMLQGSLHAQALSGSTPTLNQNLWKADILAPGLVYERRVAPSLSVAVNPSLGIGYAYAGSLGSSWVVQPTLDLQLRRYYNLERRAEKGKVVDGNSGSFFALSVFGATRSLTDTEAFGSEYHFGVGPLWGFQRTYKNNFNVSLQLGGVYSRNTSGEQGVLPQINLGLGFVLKKD